MTKIVYIYEAANELFMLKITSFFFLPVLVVNSLCKTIFFIFGIFPVFNCLEKWTSKFPVFPVPWQP